MSDGRARPDPTSPLDIALRDAPCGRAAAYHPCAKIAGIAAREVPGVHDLGGGAARAIGAFRNRINQADQAQGISVEVGETQAAVDVIVVAEYPIPLHHVADGIRTAVTTAIETLVGLEVTEVNVTIADVNIPSDDDSDNAADAPRVQ